jgi:hypothetical protein
MFVTGQDQAGGKGGGAEKGNQGGFTRMVKGRYLLAGQTWNAGGLNRKFVRIGCACFLPLGAAGKRRKALDDKRQQFQGLANHQKDQQAPQQTGPTGPASE